MPIKLYEAGLKNLFNNFMHAVDIWVLIDNSNNQGKRIAFGGKRFLTQIKDKVKFNQISKR